MTEHDWLAINIHYDSPSFWANMRPKQYICKNCGAERSIGAAGTIEPLEQTCEEYSMRTVLE